MDGLAIVVHPEWGRKQWISTETPKVVEWTEETKLQPRSPGSRPMAPRILPSEPRLDRDQRRLQKAPRRDGKLP